MTADHKATLEKGNAAIKQGNYEGFLNLCTDDTQWTFVGDKTLRGIKAVRQWMETTYLEPPMFKVEQLIAEGEFLTALGTINMKDEHGKMTQYSYCDIWRFHEGRIAELKAFVIKTQSK